jgi:acyl carrier protein
MTRKEVKKRLLEIIADHLVVPIACITEEKHLVDGLGADSLDMVELVMCVENEFEIEITDEQAAFVDTVGDAVALLVSVLDAGDKPKKRSKTKRIPTFEYCAKRLLEYCTENDVEINLSPDGVGVWTNSVTDGPGINNQSIEIDDICPAVAALNVLRKSGWKNS